MRFQNAFLIRNFVLRKIGTKGESRRGVLLEHRNIRNATAVE